MGSNGGSRAPVASCVTSELGDAVGGILGSRKKSAATGCGDALPPVPAFSSRFQSSSAGSTGASSILGKGSASGLRGGRRESPGKFDRCAGPFSGQVGLFDRELERRFERRAPAAGGVKGGIGSFVPSGKNNGRAEEKKKVDQAAMPSIDAEVRGRREVSMRSCAITVLIRFAVSNFATVVGMHL